MDELGSGLHRKFLDDFERNHFAGDFGESLQAAADMQESVVVTFDDGTVMTPIEPGQEVAAPAAANHVTVTWVDYGTPHSYDRPEGCQPPVVYEDSASAEAICDEDEATLSVTVTLGGPADNVVVYDGGWPTKSVATSRVPPPSCT